MYQIDQRSDEIVGRTLVDKVNYSLNPLSKAHKVFIWNSRLYLFKDIPSHDRKDFLQRLQKKKGAYDTKLRKGDAIFGVSKEVIDSLILDSDN